MFYFELHCHERTCSACASQSPEELVRSYHSAGYSGLVLTNHFAMGSTRIPRDIPYEEQMEAYLSAYYEVVKYAKECDFVALFGIEFGFLGGKEVLIYGLEPSFYRAHPTISCMDLRELSETVRANGGLLFQAHPFRDWSFIVDPDKPLDYTLLDGVEGHNHSNSDRTNLKAVAFAREHGLFLSSGSDNHHGLAGLQNGIATEKRIQTNADLKYYLTHPEKRKLLIRGKTINEEDLEKVLSMKDYTVL